VNLTLFSAKNLRIICLFREKVITLHPISIKNVEKMKSLNLLNAIIIIRLQGAGGSD
jgi:hypothetical protein